ncbi:DMT family transporter [Planococcus antarcticus]|uniref:QacE family quaternary ammonium compound efflux SMR transporter n=1 Tax=Planococcus antarcticus DSM 14505 TaxID=1185653 RepID=A0ABN4RJV4_9BACL|nr:multidrug efflux SMR transporter [Planococcus antarcticus]ANU12101.1 QacE family quaternary ammonium compound efflux SMR transporter [Planococcus antarcticus DSM 14505]
MDWLILIVAGLFEVVFVTTMKLSNGFKVKRYTALTIVSGALSFYLLSLALTTIELGTGYAVWTGIGAAGSVLVGMLFFNESRQPAKLFFLSCIIAGVVGLKIFGG